MLYREPKLLKAIASTARVILRVRVSVLYREPKLLKVDERECDWLRDHLVSVLYREPKLLKGYSFKLIRLDRECFSALP